MFVSRRFASRIHDIGDLKTLVLSLRAEYTRIRESIKYTEHDRNAKLVAGLIMFSKQTGASYIVS